MDLLTAEDENVPGEVLFKAMAYAQNRDMEKNAKREASKVGNELKPFFKDNPGARIEVGLDFERNAVVSLRKREDLKINVDKLRYAIGGWAVGRLLTNVLDPSKVEQAIAEGWLDPAIVASCTEVTTTEYIDARPFKRQVEEEE